jgi:1-aminocyclopropane-1-carboxylate deaminase
MDDHDMGVLKDVSGGWPDQISPLDRLYAEVFDRVGVRVFVKRDDLLTPYGGNKWRKLKYNFLRMKEEGKTEFITFGGPFSNHVYASATLAKEYHLKATFLIRGEISDRNNPALKYARDCGVTLRGLDRKTYAERYSTEFKADLEVAHPSAFMIPEGGANTFGLKGCGEIVNETARQLDRNPDVWLVAAGTGNTAAGIANKLFDGGKVVAISALRPGIIQSAWQNSLDMISESARHRLTLSDAFHFGGMAKWNDELVSFMKKFEADQGILLDPIYTGKAMYALFDLAARRVFERGSTIVFVHTGGMPGRMSFNYRYGDLL